MKVSLGMPIIVKNMKIKINRWRNSRGWPFDILNRYLLLGVFFLREIFDEFCDRLLEEEQKVQNAFYSASIYAFLNIQSAILYELSFYVCCCVYLEVHVKIQRNASQRTF